MAANNFFAEYAVVEKTEVKNATKGKITSINKMLKHPIVRRFPVHIKSMDDILLTIKNIYTLSIVPIFYTSCVTGQGMDNLKMFFNLIGKNPENFKKKSDENVVEFHVDHLFYVQGFGTVVGGYLISGDIKIGDKLLLGPNMDSYEPIFIKTIYCKKIPLQKVSFGEYVCLGIKKTDIKIKKGNVKI